MQMYLYGLRKKTNESLLYIHGVISNMIRPHPDSVSLPSSTHTLTTGAAILFHVHQTWWCYSQGLTWTILSPIPALSRMCRMVPLSCTSLHTETPQQKQTMNLQAPPCLLELWVLLGGVNGAFQYSQIEKKERKGNEKRN